jgi:hypothetical protein
MKGTSFELTFYAYESFSSISNLSVVASSSTSIAEVLKNFLSCDVTFDCFYAVNFRIPSTTSLACFKIGALFHFDSARWNCLPTIDKTAVLNDASIVELLLYIPKVPLGVILVEVRPRYQL